MLKLIVAMVKTTWEQRLFDVAAQMAYYFLLAFFPLLIVILNIISFFPVGTAELLELISPYIPDQIYSFIQSTLNDIFTDQRVNVLSISSIATVWLTFLGSFAVIRAVNKAYQLPHPSLKRMVGVGSILVVSFLTALLVSLLFPIFGEPIGEFIFSTLGVESWLAPFWSVVRWSISVLVIGIVLIILYTIVPSKRISWRDTWPGALFATIGWQIASLGFSFYNQYNDYSIIYGSLGTIIGLMVWFFLTGLMILLGAQLNALRINVHKHEGET
ncbi:YihY/virulence factor BrkB family protein [Geomicrobium sp. JCM 19038]|uniref:YihY/virulence factor BrkB family protein n=1 Tax=Geomicrobium sp. JCM 19038 TaxID=1460635 RepID=UPI00045F305D|nr:YihY/virulence factor BrkB family protein [Geomicrobium sp. JCM 19038]GAK10068.1 ribonuclease BN [Geomicrobium sp. JCM 19038]